MGTPLNRQGGGGAFVVPKPSKTIDRRWAVLDAAALASRSAKSSRRSDRDGGDESASESGASALSNFLPPGGRAKAAPGTTATPRDLTSSPLRTWARWMRNSGKSSWFIPVLVAVALLVKFAVGLGGYSGLGAPPLRGDLEAQRHWLSLTSSSLKSTRLHQPSSYSVSYDRWYDHDRSYWGLDYPPLTAYHSLLLGALARLSSTTAPFVALRPESTSPAHHVSAWNAAMVGLERAGAMKSWMRASVVWGDLLVWITAVVTFCRIRGLTGLSQAVAALTVLLQPALILVDNGHFQYNSIMLGLTLWSVNLFHGGHDLLGAVAFVLSLGFKQMALYYSPAIFAYLLGKCLWIGGRPGMALLIRIGTATVASFALLFAPFLFPPSLLLQAINRIFPFARGLFEDKVANVWCALNVAVKLRDLASVGVLAKLALFATLCAVLPSVIGMLWVSHEAGRRSRASGTNTPDDTSVGNPPTLALLPHALFVSAMAFFLFSFQVHEKSILLPLMPLTILMGGREAGFGRLDWEWAVLLNNIGVFSMWPLLKRDGVGLQYIVVLAAWNAVIGYNPFKLRRSFVKYLSLASYAVAFLIHALELVAAPPAHLPDLFVVLNLTVSAGVFALGFLWASKRLVQEGWAAVGNAQF
ncbi:hypothetical protein RQP46_011339 [Phenoliferia psychrophenolica]